MAGFSFVEHLRGTYYRLAEPLKECPIALDFEAHVRRLRTPSASVNGRIHAEGLADAPVQGTIGLHPLSERRVPYDLAFVGHDGLRYHLRGDKDLSWLAPVATLAELPFAIVIEDAAWTEVARGTLRFEIGKGSVRSFVRSLRASPF